MAIDIIRPEIFKREENLRAFFTLKNEVFGNKKQATIQGLNLGFNTGEAPEVIENNRRELFETFNIDSHWVAFANQVHSNRVKIVTDGGTFAETDGLITQVPGLALAIQVADCAAMFIADTKSNIIAAVHAGWRGAAGDIVPRAIEKMIQLGADSSDCKAFISPCISLKNFEVGNEVANQFPDTFVDFNSYEKPHINLKAFLNHQLKVAGLQESNIEIHPECTIVEEDKYYSYRRDKDESGRMMAVIQLTEG